MQHHSSVRSAAHPAVADTHHVAYALLEQLLRQRHVRHFRHPGVALGPAAAQHQHGVRIHIQLRIVDAGVEVLNAVEDQRGTAMLDQVRGGRCGFDDGAGGGEVAAQHCDATFGQQRLASQPDHLRVPDGSGVQVVDQWTPSDGDGRWVEEFAHLPQNCEQPTGTVEVIHKKPARGLQVDQQRDM